MVADQTYKLSASGRINPYTEHLICFKSDDILREPPQSPQATPYHTGIISSTQILGTISGFMLAGTNNLQ
jgi:hypothetical protein